MKLRKLTAILLAVVLTMGIVASTALAATSYCQRKVGNKQCGLPLYWYSDGRSINYSSSHKYGGFLGIGQQTCYFDYYYTYTVYKCSSGHVADSSSTYHETGHDCGK